MLLGDAGTVVVHHSGLSDDEVRRSQRLLVAEISVFDFQRTKEGKSQRASPINNRPGNGVRDVVQKDRQAKRSRTPARGRQLAVYFDGEVIGEAPPLASFGALVVPAFHWLWQCIRPWRHRDGFHYPRLGHRRAAR
jgi:hypothetical protein